MRFIRGIGDNKYVFIYSSGERVPVEIVKKHFIKQNTDGNARFGEFFKFMTFANVTVDSKKNIISY